MSTRTPIVNPVTKAATEFYGEEMRDGHGVRVFARRVNKEVLVQGTNSMQHPVETFIVYRNNNSTNPLMPFTLQELPADARHSRMVTSGDGQTTFDMYANKPGWAFAKPQDVTEMILMGAAIQKGRVAQRAASTPEAASARLASEVAVAVAGVLKGGRDGK